LGDRGEVAGSSPASVTIQSAFQDAQLFLGPGDQNAWATRYAA
jgi:hypothetical protein